MFFFKSLFKSVFLFAAMTSAVVAQLEKIQEPSEVGTLFNIDYQKNTDSDAGIESVIFNNKLITLNSAGNTGKYWMDGFFEGLRPGTEYVLEITNPISKPYCLSVIPPKGYVVEINGSLRNGVPETNRSSATTHYRVVLRSSEAMDSGNSRPVGHSSGLKITDIKWEAGLGKTSSGNAAGFISIESKDLTPTIFKREGVAVCVPPLTSSEIKLIYEDLDLDGTKESIRQIKSAQCLVDFVDMPQGPSGTTGYEIRFYGSGEMNNSSGLYNPVGETLVVYKVLKNSVTSLTISQTDSWGTVSDTASYVAHASQKDWKLITSGGDYVKQRTVENTWDSNDIGRLEKSTIEYTSKPAGHPSNANSAFRVNRFFHFMDFGINSYYKLTKETFNPQTSLEYLTKYNYNSNYVHPNFGLLNGRLGPFGAWEAYEYEIHANGTENTSLMSSDFVNWCNANQLGSMYPALLSRTKKVVAEYSPETDAFNFEVAKSYKAKLEVANGSVRKKQTELAYGWNELHPLPIRIEDFTGDGSVAASMGAALAFPLTRDAVNGNGSSYLELLASYDVSKRGIWPNINPEATKWKARHVPSTRSSETDGSLSMKPYMEIDADNRKTIYGYAKLPSYGGVSNAWVEAKITGLQPSEIVDYPQNRRVSITSPSTGAVYNAPKNLELYYDMIGQLGDLRDGDQYSGSIRDKIYAEAKNRYILPGNLIHDGIQFPHTDALTLVPGKSLKEINVYNEQGEVAKKETWAYIGTEWKPVETLLMTRDAFGRLLKITKVDGVTSVRRLIYEAWYNGLRLTGEKDETGLTTSYTYDGLGRLAAKSIAASHSFPSMPTAFTTSYKYDAMDRMVETKNGTQKTSKTYDAGKLLLSETDANNLTTSYTYSEQSGAGMRVDVSLPGGATETRIYHRNGRLKSVTGSSSIAKYFTYGYESDGTSWTRTDIGVDSSSTARHPWHIEWKDWNRRTTKIESSSPSSSSNFGRSYVYNPADRKLIKTIETEVSLDGSAVTQSNTKQIEYNSWGEPVATGTDIDGGGLSDASSDRLSRSQGAMVEIGGVLYASGTSKSYPKEGESFALTTTSMTKMNGFPPITVSESKTSDAYGNVVLTTVTSDFSGVAKVRKSYPDGTSESVISVFGLPVNLTDRQGGITSNSYDAIGRLVQVSSQAGDRYSTTRYEYLNATNLVSKVISDIPSDGTGAAKVVTYGYDAAGRVVSTINAIGETAFSAYNSRGQQVKQWGTAVSPIWFEYDTTYGTLSKQYMWPVLPSASPDFAAATSPPTGASVVGLDRDNATGLVKSRTDGLGSASARVTDYTYDVLGQLRTVQTPSCAAGENSVLTSRITISHSYFPKTGEKASTTYSDGSTPSVGFTWHRSGAMKSVTEADIFTRNFNYNFSGNGVTALQPISEDLPSYYSDVPELGGFTGGDGKVDRILHAYSTTGTIGQWQGIYCGSKGGSGSSVLTGIRGTTLFSYSSGLISGGQLSDSLSGAPAILAYRYENGSSLLNRRSIGSMEETRSYSQSRNLLTSIQTKGSQEVRSRCEFSYDVLGRKTNMSQAGSLYSIYGGSLRTDYSYDTRDQLVSSVTSIPALGAVPGRSFGYGYDLANNRRLTSRGGAPAGQASFNWGITPLNQTSSRQNPQWGEVSGQTPEGKGLALQSLDASMETSPARAGRHFHSYYSPAAGSGVRKETLNIIYAEPGAGGADPAHPGENKDLVDRRQVEVRLRPASESLKYDGRGNLASDSMWIYSWDGADRLRSVESSPASISAGLPKIKLVFSYDWMGRRYSKESYAWNGVSFAALPEKVTYFWWNDWDLIREASYLLSWSGNSLVSKSFISESMYSWGIDLSGSLKGAGGVGGLLSITTKASGQQAKKLLPAYDGMGNVIAVLDESGVEQGSYEYDPFGNSIRSSGAAASLNPFRFSTKYVDQETKLIYHNARYYSPEMGRFLSRDPILEDGGSNLYTYAGNNVPNVLDVLGYHDQYAHLPTHEIKEPIVIHAWQDMNGGWWFLSPDQWGNYSGSEWEFYEDVGEAAQPNFVYNSVPGESPAIDWGLPNQSHGGVIDASWDWTVDTAGGLVSMALDGLQPYREGAIIRNFERIEGMARLAITMSSVVSPYQFQAANSIPGQVEFTTNLVNDFTGGQGKDGSYRATYTTLNVASLLIPVGGELRAGNLVKIESSIVTKAELTAAKGTGSFANYMRTVEKLDVSTARNSAVFYSGPGNRALAESFAKANGRTTLEMTTGGGWLDAQKLFSPSSGLTPQQATQVWSRLSQRFAEGASGNGVGFVNGARSGSIFNTVEYPSLLNNPNVGNVLTGGH